MLDVTVAGPSANSYLSVADADALADADLGKNAKRWLSATTDEKERALLRAARDLDDYVERVAARYDEITPQALLFPRSSDVLNNVAFIPGSVARAAYEQASYLMVNADQIDDAASRRAQGLANYSNPDGTSGSLATEFGDGLIGPRARRLLDRLTGGAVIAEIVTT